MSAALRVTTSHETPSETATRSPASHFTLPELTSAFDSGPMSAVNTTASAGDSAVWAVQAAARTPAMAAMMSLYSVIGIVVESAPVKTFADDFTCGRCGGLTVRGAVLCPRPGLLPGCVLHNPCKFSIISRLRQGFVLFPTFAFPECPWTDCGGKGCRPWEVRGCRGFLQGRKNPRRPGPRPVHALPSLALQAAGPSTRPDEAGVTFPRCDTLPGSASERREIIHKSFAVVLYLFIHFAARVGKISAIYLTTPCEL